MKLSTTTIALPLAVSGNATVRTYTLPESMSNFLIGNGFPPLQPLNEKPIMNSAGSFLSTEGLALITKNDRAFNVVYHPVPLDLPEFEIDAEFIVRGATNECADGFGIWLANNENPYTVSEWYNHAVEPFAVTTHFHTPSKHILGYRNRPVGQGVMFSTTSRLGVIKSSVSVLDADGSVVEDNQLPTNKGIYFPFESAQEIDGSEIAGAKPLVEAELARNPFLYSFKDGKYYKNDILKVYIKKTQTELSVKTQLGDGEWFNVSTITPTTFGDKLMLSAGNTRCHGDLAKGGEKGMDVVVTKFRVSAKDILADHHGHNHGQEFLMADSVRARSSHKRSWWTGGNVDSAASAAASTDKEIKSIVEKVHKSLVASEDRVRALLDNNTRFLREMVADAINHNITTNMQALKSGISNDNNLFAENVKEHLRSTNRSGLVVVCLLISALSAAAYMTVRRMEKKHLL